MKRFKCEMCGYCCSKFDQGYLPVFPWEAEKLKQKAKEKNLQNKIKIKPVYVMKDAISGIQFFPFYGMFNEPCPFRGLDEKNKCSIHKERPLICRMFPLYRSPFNNSKEIDRTIFYYCPNNYSMIDNFIEEVKNLPREIQSEKYQETFGECFEALNEWIKIKTYVDSSIMDLQNQGKISLESVKDTEEENLKEDNLMSVFEFLDMFGY